MGVKEWGLSFFKKHGKQEDIQEIEEILIKEARHISSTGRHLFSIPFDGEKNLGEIGPVKEYLLDYDRLRLRSWQSYLESEITQTVIGKFTKWVIGSGLKLQSEPNKRILQDEGVNIDSIGDFTKSVEARYNQWAKSKTADYSGMQSLNEIEKAVFLNAKIGGDCLVVLRTVKGRVKVQIVDGCHIRHNLLSSDYYPLKLDNGNYVCNGIEFNSTGQHVAYWVLEDSLKPAKRVKARNSNGTVQAFLVYGRKYRLDNHRGMPLIAVVLETLKKLERYKEATVGSAEERQKIAFQIVHGVTSTGESPLSKQMAKAFDFSDESENLPADIAGNELANNIAATTNKQTYNMPIDSELKQLESKNELHFKDFYSVNIDIVCACLGIPPEVAMSKYDSNFSASRAALKDWEHTLLVERNEFKDGFMQYVYDYWFEIQVNTFKIKPRGYNLLDIDGKESYRNARFIGANVPHIDPEKEVRAERAKLGTLSEHLPLTTQEAATEALNGGDSVQNTMNFSKELEEAKMVGLEAVQMNIPNNKPKDEE